MVEFETKSSNSEVTKTLLSAERAEKLDLVLHLIATQNQPVAITGPAGVGKTTLFNTLQQCPEVSSDCCYLAVEQTDTQASILQKSAKVLNLSEDQGWQLALDQCLKQRQLILLIDDAGTLKPGVLDALNEFAAQHDHLKLVYALSQDESSIKLHTDPSLDACHFVEIPPLTERGVRDFLMNLSAVTKAPISFQAINDEMVRQLYEESSGLPGKISQSLPQINTSVGAQQNTLYVVVVLVAALALLTYVLFHSDSEQEIEVLSAPVHSGSPSNDDILSKGKPNAPREVASTMATESSSDKPIIENLSPPDSEDSVATQTTVEPSASQAPAQQVLADTHSASSVQPVADGEAWLMKLPNDHYILQLMVLTQSGHHLQLKKQYPKLDQIFEIKSKANGKYYLVYGDFADYQQAKAFTQRLPDKLRQAWVRNSAKLKADLGLSQ